MENKSESETEVDVEREANEGPPFQNDRNTLDDEEVEEELVAAQLEERRQAEIRAAKRSIETNLFLGLAFLIVYGIFILMSNKLRQSYSIIAFSTLKGLLPIFTTITNFGTVHSVLLQYWKSLMK